MPPTETELKLRLDPKHVARLKNSTALAATAPRDTEVINVYFDTADRLLQRHSMALRVRQIDGRWLQTLKIAGKRGALSQRGEWETPARVVRGGGRLDLTRFADAPLQELLAAQKQRPQLQAVFRTRFRRTQWLIKRADALIEVALDVGEITAGSAVAQREPICEVELELKEGNPAALIETAFELLDLKGKARPALTPVARSKAERGYQLASRQPATAIKASAKGFVAGLTRETTTANALRIALAHGVAVLTANAELLLQLDDPELVHQARVALRRVRSAIRLLDADERDVPPALSGELRWLARALGAARDWDVIVDETLPSLVEAIGAERVSALQAKAGQRRQRARTKIAEAVGSARYAVLVLNAEYWCMTRAGEAPPLGDSSASLQEAAKRLFKAGRFFSALTPERRHRVRILAKRLRYALDLFAVALPKQATTRYIEALAQLQDVLGQLNDGSVALTVLPQLSKSRRMEESMQNWWSSIELELVRDSESRLLQLSKMDVPW